MGRGVIDGIECEHLAFRNPDTDWQLWVEVATGQIAQDGDHEQDYEQRTPVHAPGQTVENRWRSRARDFEFVPPAG